MTQLSLSEYESEQHQSDEQQEAFEAEYGRLLRKQWEDDLETVRQRGVIPDWIGEPKPLSVDKARLLEVLYDRGCVSWTSNPSRNNRDVTRAIGLTSTANAKQVIDACVSAKLAKYEQYNGSLVIVMTQEGEFALEEYQLDMEMGIM